MLLQYGAFEDGDHVVLIEEYGAWVSGRCCPPLPFVRNPSG